MHPFSKPPFLLQLMILPMLMTRFGPRGYHAAGLFLQAMLLCAAAAWLAAPVAIGGYYGAPWMLLWLIPTAAAIFLTALTPSGGG